MSNFVALNFTLGQYGNSLPVARTEQQVIAAMRDAGFEVMEFRDLARDGDWPW